MSNQTELIQITLNGKPNEVVAGLTVSDLLLKWKIRPELVTVEVNETILRSWTMTRRVWRPATAWSSFFTWEVAR